MAMKTALIAPVVLLGAALLAAAPALPANAATAASVTINATAGIGTIPAGAIGLDTAVYDGDMNDAAIPPLLKAAGIDAMRYPGGSYSDIYNWQTQTAVDGGFVAPNTSFANFMTTANSAGAKPIITVNYGTGTPSLAAAWVHGGGQRLGRLLGSRQRGVRERHLRGQLGNRLPLRDLAERACGDGRQ